jgi:hypothetical protein
MTGVSRSELMVLIVAGSRANRRPASDSRPSLRAASVRNPNSRRLRQPAPSPPSSPARRSDDASNGARGCCIAMPAEHEPVTTERPANGGPPVRRMRLSERGREWVPRKPQAPWLGRDATRVDYASLRDLAGEDAAKEVSLPTTAPPAFTTSAPRRSTLMRTPFRAALRHVSSTSAT